MCWLLKKGTTNKLIFKRKDKPWRSRIFSIEDKTDNDYFEEDDDTHDENENKGDIDGKLEGTSSITNEKKERYFIYEKDTETYRIAIPFRDAIINEGEETSDDPRNGGKMEIKLNQKNAVSYTHLTLPTICSV